MPWSGLGPDVSLSLATNSPVTLLKSLCLVRFEIPYEAVSPILRRTGCHSSSPHLEKKETHSPQTGASRLSLIGQESPDMGYALSPRPVAQGKGMELVSSPLTMHVLDTVSGLPVQGLCLHLSRFTDYDQKNYTDLDAHCPITFTITNATHRFHVPLLLSLWSYTTY
ncbi:hypothetical protein GH733_018402 [Mirounga leonina]|nr:hypothetical protein GH733_018402 [Mirounga leonina]